MRCPKAWHMHMRSLASLLLRGGLPPVQWPAPRLPVVSMHWAVWAAAHMQATHAFREADRQVQVRRQAGLSEAGRQAGSKEPGSQLQCAHNIPYMPLHTPLMPRAAANSFKIEKGTDYYSATSYYVTTNDYAACAVECNKRSECLPAPMGLMVCLGACYRKGSVGDKAAY